MADQVRTSIYKCRDGDPPTFSQHLAIENGEIAGKHEDLTYRNRKVTSKRHSMGFGQTVDGLDLIGKNWGEVYIHIILSLGFILL